MTTHLSSEEARAARARLWKKRLDIESHWDANYRRLLDGFLGWRRVFSIQPILRFALWATRLQRRGEENALRPVLRRHEFRFRTLPPAFDGLRILHISDVHFWESERFLETACAAVTGCEADLCLFTGDYWFEKEGPTTCVYRGMERLLARIDAPLGCFGVFGNNDRSEFLEPFQRMGLRLLVNSSTHISRGDATIALAGVDDPKNFACDSLPAAVADVPPGAFLIFLAHTPQLADEAAACGAQLYLCGHTHAGQIRIRGLGPLLKNVRCAKQSFYCCWVEGAMQGHTSGGLGTVCVPVRFNCPPEVTVLTLRCGTPLIPRPSR